MVEVKSLRPSLSPRLLAMDPAQAAAQAKFARLGFFILPLPRGSDFGIDGRLWTVDKFSVR